MSSKVIKLKIMYERIPLSVKSSFWFMVANMIQQGVNIITTPIYTRILSESDYGMVSVYNSWSALLIVFATLNLSYGVFNNGMIDFEDDKDNFTSSLLLLTVLLVITSFVLYIIFNEPLHMLIGFDNKLIIIMFLSFLSNATIAFWMSKERFEYKYKACVIVSIIMLISKVVISLYLVISNNEDKYFYKILGDAIPGYLIATVIATKVFLNGKKCINFRYWKYAISFNLILVPHYLAGNILSTSDRIMIDRFAGTDKAGIYSIGYSIASIITVLFSAINASWIPYTYKKLKNEEYKQLKNSSSKLTIFVAGIAFIFILLAPELVGFFAPMNYHEATYIIPIIVMGLYFSYIYSLFANIEFYYKKNKFVMIGSIISAIVNLALNYIYIKKYGYMAAAYTTLLGYFILSILHYIFMKKTCKNEVYDIKFLIKTSLLFLLTSTIILTLYPSVILRMLILLGIIILATKEIVLLFRTSKDNNEIRNII